MKRIQAQKTCMQLALVRKSIKTGNFDSFEEFVKLDRYRQDLEMEIAVNGKYEAGIVLSGKE
ncbi:MAG: hypothetical protein SCALA701_01070 [Candidatus Scalindua sp.]|nr:MAG: hypothetical protein DWQ00_10275 [Candidatus Scalindua sp.]NOG85196.1 hypothetical protein [Planctomycetota bacterium]RZV64316.1 MAG: hypothetical protein EX341_18185 [Candidatus Scalindua sp. SCAELEC01]GJQ57306.1 MAG: hypothetical protein SCALA701_01070 [Candidatus Scalindua sp.]